MRSVSVVRSRVKDVMQQVVECVACGTEDEAEYALYCVCGDAVCADCISLHDDGDLCPTCEETKVSDTKKAKRGFAAMSPELQKSIAAKGGRAAHVKGTAHEFTSAEAAVAGKKGGAAIVARGKEYLSEIGRRGGQTRQANARAKKASSGSTVL